MTVLVAVVAAGLVALVVVLEARSWRARARVVTFTITVDTSGLEDAFARAGVSASRLSEARITDYVDVSTLQDSGPVWYPTRSACAGRRHGHIYGSPTLHGSDDCLDCGAPRHPDPPSNPEEPHQ